MIRLLRMFNCKIFQNITYNMLFNFLVFWFKIVLIYLSFWFINLLASSIKRLLILLLSSFIASKFMLVALSSSLSTCRDRFWKNSLIAFFETFFSPPKWLFNATKNCTQTKAWASVWLKNSYNSNGERIPSVLTNAGIDPQGITTAGNWQEIYRINNKSVKYFKNFCRVLFIF